MSKLLTLNIPNLRRIVEEKVKVNGNFTSTYKRAKNILRILERDHYNCISCGSNKNLTIDHIKTRKQISKSQYHFYAPSCCQTLCRKCHNKKNNNHNKLSMYVCENCTWITVQGFKGQKCSVCSSNLRFLKEKRYDN